MSAPETCACADAARVGKEGNNPDTVAIIVAGGTGERFGDPRGKQFVDLCGLPLMCWPLLAFDHAPSIGHIVVVCAPDRVDTVNDEVLSRVTLLTPVTPPRETRANSPLRTDLPPCRAVTTS